MQKQSELDKLQIGLTGGTQEGYINIVGPKFQRMYYVRTSDCCALNGSIVDLLALMPSLFPLAPSSASPGTVAMTLHLLPALLITFLMMSVLS